MRVQLELGGKDAAYVCDDVDVDEAALAVAEGAFYNGGQSCSATERVYVHEAIADAFVATLVDVVRAYRVGDPTDDATDVGPLARAEQLDVLDAQLADAVQRGAKVLCGGDRIDQPGNWFEPTVVVDVPDAAVADGGGELRARHRRCAGRERQRGDRAHERHRVRARRIRVHPRSGSGRAPARGLDVGNAYWNTADRSCVRLPWAGRRHSGLGTSMSESGVRTFVKEKAWHLFP